MKIFTFQYFFFFFEIEMKYRLNIAGANLPQYCTRRTKNWKQLFLVYLKKMKVFFSNNHVKI